MIDFCRQRITLGAQRGQEYTPKLCPLLGPFDMSMDFAGIDAAATLGLIAAALSIAAYMPYAIDTVARRTRPHRASWLIWTTLSSIAFATQIFEGATTSVGFAAAQVLGTGSIFVLSIFYGQGGYLNRQDGLTLGMAAIGLGFWAVTEDPAYALAMTIAISLLGGVATSRKAFAAPLTETALTWFMSLLAAGVAILAIDGQGWILWAYPVYMFTVNAMILVAIHLGMRRHLLQSLAA